MRNGEVLFVGIGLPNLACNLARRLHAHRPGADLRIRRSGRNPERLPTLHRDSGVVDKFAKRLLDGTSSTTTYKADS